MKEKADCHLPTGNGGRPVDRKIPTEGPTAGSLTNPTTTVRWAF